MYLKNIVSIIVLVIPSYTKSSRNGLSIIYKNILQTICEKLEEKYLTYSGSKVWTTTSRWKGCIPGWICYYYAWNSN